MTAAAFMLRAGLPAESAPFARDIELVRQSLDLGQSLFAPQADGPPSFKYPLSLTLYLSAVYGALYVVGAATSTFASVGGFADFLFANRDQVYLLAVYALNLLSVMLIPAIWLAQRKLNPRHGGWIAAGLAATNLLLLHFGAQPRPHVPYATLAFCATALLVAAAHATRGRVLLAATVTSALTVGALQSGALIVAPFLLALALRPVRAGKYHWRELRSLTSIGSLALFAGLCLALYPDFVSEYGRLLGGLLGGGASTFQLGGGAHQFESWMFGASNIPQFAARLSSYQPVLTALLPLSALYFVLRWRRKPKLLVVALVFPLLNLIIWALYSGTFPRIQAVFIPFMIFAASHMLEDLLESVAGRLPDRATQIRAGLTLLLLIPPAVSGLRLAHLLTQTDSRILAARWINEQIPHGAAILLNFPQPGLAPTSDAVARQERDFPGTVGARWHWLARQNDSLGARYDMYKRLYWQALEAEPAARDRFISEAGIRYALVWAQVAEPAHDPVIVHARRTGRLLRDFCPAREVAVAELPDDMFNHAWRQIWQIERPGGFVALYDLQDPPDAPVISRYCAKDG